MALTIGASITLDIDNQGHGYLDIDLHVQVGVLNLDLSIETQPKGFVTETVAGALSPLAPLPSLGSGLLDTVLPPVADSVVGLTDNVIDGLFLPDSEPTPGSTSVIDLGGTLLNLPGIFKS